ncbi:MAG TPA: LysR family transcriptional regulator [Methylomirabilota bacterium]|nr:LysR family transcriptional regulator [Methylomirabilota bacterium]
MELHQLRYFLAIAEEKSFSRAAERAHVAQPSLSQQIQKLEAELGVRLFDRLNRRVTLTQAGHALVPFAERILNEIRDARRCLGDQDEEQGGAVRLGMIPTIAPYVAPRLMTVAAERHPRISIELKEAVTDDLFDATERGEVDFSVISTCRKVQTLHAEEVASEPLFVALGESHPLAKKPALEWADLKPVRIVTLQESHCLSRQVEKVCRAHNIKVDADMPLLQLSTLLALVCSGLAVSLVPEMATKTSGASCIFKRIRRSPPAREINLLRNSSRYQSRAAALIMQLAAEILRSITGSKSSGRPSTATCELILADA